ncbi:protein S100-A6-like [Festucalex cinctus]
MPRQLQHMIEKFVDLFDEYSSDESDCLSREQFKALVTDEINAPDYDGKLELSDIDEFFDELDKNDDNQLTFKEYICVMGKMIQCHRKKAGRWGRRGGRGGRWRRGGRGSRGSRGGSSGDDDEERRGGRGGKGGRGGSDDDEERGGGPGGRGGKGGKGGRGGF